MLLALTAPHQRGMLYWICTTHCTKTKPVSICGREVTSCHMSFCCAYVKWAQPIAFAHSLCDLLSHTMSALLSPVLMLCNLLCLLQQAARLSCRSTFCHTSVAPCTSGCSAICCSAECRPCCHVRCSPVGHKGTGRLQAQARSAQLLSWSCTAPARCLGCLARIGHTAAVMGASKELQALLSITNIFCSSIIFICIYSIYDKQIPDCESV